MRPLLILILLISALVGRSQSFNDTIAKKDGVIIINCKIERVQTIHVIYLIKKGKKDVKKHISMESIMYIVMDGKKSYNSDYVDSLDSLQKDSTSHLANINYLPEAPKEQQIDLHMEDSQEIRGLPGIIIGIPLILLGTHYATKKVEPRPGFSGAVGASLEKGTNQIMAGLCIGGGAISLGFGLARFYSK